MKTRILSVLCAVLLLSSCTETPEVVEPQSLTVYSGRSKGLVEPLVEKFTAATGIEVNVRYAGTSELAVTLMEEKDNSPADVFWAQDAGALGAVAKAGLFADLPDGIGSNVMEAFTSANGQWIATSGRARSLAYAPAKVSADELPGSIMELTNPKWNGRVGWAPTNGSFQAAVTALRVRLGDEAVKTWLEGMMANGAKSYPKNSAIVEAIANGDVDLGIPNHYYLLRFLNEDPNYPVSQVYFDAGDAGNLVNIAGAGLLKSGDQETGAKFVEYLLSADAQSYFTQEVFEYPVSSGTATHSNLIPMDELMSKTTAIDLNDLDDLEATLDLLREVGLI